MVRKMETKSNNSGIVDAIRYASRGVSTIYEARAKDAMNCARQLRKYKDQIAETIVQQEKHGKADKKVRKWFSDVCRAYGAAMSEYERLDKISKKMTNRPYIPLTQK